MNTVVKTDFSEVVAEITEAIDSAKKKAEEALMNEFRAIFVRHPEFKCMVWTQYTPYFNDGDACEFSVNDPYISTSEAVNAWGEFDNEDDEEGNDVFSRWELKQRKGYEDIIAVMEFMETSVGNEVLQFAFGDHVEVRVTSRGIDVNDYEHE